MHGTDRVSTSAANLVRRPALAIADIHADPATRCISGPGGAITVPPRVMHLLLVLLDAQGAVVTRDELTQAIWNGRFVAEDSLNGAVAELRRALHRAGAERIKVVTVPKSGYRIACPAPAKPGEDTHLLADRSRRAIPRRWFMAGGAAAFAGLATMSAWRVTSTPSHADRFVGRGLLALRQGLPDPQQQGVADFQRAVKLDPDHARAWGLLALSLRAAAEYSPPAQVAGRRAEAELAARRALAIDRQEPHAMTALALLMPSFGNWLQQERRLRQVLEVDPQNRFATAALATLLMSTGQVRACLKRLDFLERLDPLSPDLQFRRVYTLWSSGRLADADATADRAMQSWPNHPAVWFARFWTFAFTDRADRALVMLHRSPGRPPMPAQAMHLLNVSLEALSDPAGGSKSQAVAANKRAAAVGPGQAITAIMVLSALGEAAEAYEVARGFLVQRGPVLVNQRHTHAQPSVTDQHHRMTMMLWIPATQNLRLEPRFGELCTDMGLVRYWKEAGTGPDFRGGSLTTI
ncbi:winged helix-turn-helix domain-containing protein [Porphyrobacter sp. GA68]|uniref:winged helix-turn-helix domain-containing protein n=1 Tax=Porphyrobacter sp. GA68 TaxID=2883480 RepID=UPI001D194634|nr:winged helix-turn-helix domain-containing protein [Porphyrobacter sp. GA68]